MYRTEVTLALLPWDLFQRVIAIVATSELTDKPLVASRLRIFARKDLWSVVLLSLKQVYRPVLRSEVLSAHKLHYFAVISSIPWMCGLVEKVESGAIDREQFVEEAAFRNKSSKYLEALVSVCTDCINVDDMINTLGLHVFKGQVYKSACMAYRPTRVAKGNARQIDISAENEASIFARYIASSWDFKRGINAPATEEFQPGLSEYAFKFSDGAVVKRRVFHAFKLDGGLSEHAIKIVSQTSLRFCLLINILSSFVLRCAISCLSNIFKNRESDFRGAVLLHPHSVGGEGDTRVVIDTLQAMQWPFVHLTTFTVRFFKRKAFVMVPDDPALETSGARKFCATYVIPKTCRPQISDDQAQYFACGNVIQLPTTADDTTVDVENREAGVFRYLDAAGCDILLQPLLQGSRNMTIVDLTTCKKIHDHVLRHRGDVELGSVEGYDLDLACRGVIAMKNVLEAQGDLIGMEDEPRAPKKLTKKKKRSESSGEELGSGNDSPNSAAGQVRL